MTIEQQRARARLANCHMDWVDGEWDDEMTPHDYLAAWRDVERAEVGMGGSLLILDSDNGYCLGDNEAMNFVSWLGRIGAIKANN